MKEKIIIVLNGNELVPRELTVGEVEAVMESLMDHGVHVLERAAKEEPVPAVATALSVDLVRLNDSDRFEKGYLEKVDLLKRLTATEVRSLCEQVRLKNDFLAQEVGALVELGRRIQEEEAAKEVSVAALKISGDLPQD